MTGERYDAAIIGSGPNGLAAAVTLARAGKSVVVLEAKETIGGGSRSGEVTLPGFVHDICSAVHPLAASSPFFRDLPLDQFGLEWVHPAIPLAHPLPGGEAAILMRSLADMARQGVDGAGYANMIRPFVEGWDDLSEEILQPIVHVPRSPLLLTRFGLRSLPSAKYLAERFETEPMRAMIAGLAGHAMLRLDKWLTASFGMVLAASAHAVGWPFAKGGSQSIVDALSAYLVSLGGEVRVSSPVRSMADIPPARVTLFDVGPRQLLDICGDKLSGRYRRQLMGYRRGEGVFKVDFALSGPVPWFAEACQQAGTVHVGGTLAEMLEAEHAVATGKIPERPYVLAAQQSRWDRTRAPAGKETFWAYCHVPYGSTEDMTDRIEERIEEFAPGFRDLIIGRRSMSPADFGDHNENMRGGDISGGSNGGLQLFFRPGLRLRPYHTPAKGIFLCSASTPPGGGVHGMAGYWAAKAALKQLT